MNLNIFLLLAVLFCTSSNTAAQKTEKAVIQTKLHCDHCKGCGTCGKMFEAEFHKIKGLKKYHLNEAAMTFTIYYDITQTNLMEIKKTIAQLGYDADEIKADPEADQKLDRCCKK